MIESFPVDFELESGAKVMVDKRAAELYDFTILTPGKPARLFTYVDDGRPKAHWDETLDFEQLEALRKFWLMNEDVV